MDSGAKRRKTTKRFLISKNTGRIRNQHHQIDQKKLVPLITSDVDPSLTLPLVYMMIRQHLGHSESKC